VAIGPLPVAAGVPSHGPAVTETRPRHPDTIAPTEHLTPARSATQWTQVAYRSGNDRSTGTEHPSANTTADQPGTPRWRRAYSCCALVRLLIVVARRHDPQAIDVARRTYTTDPGT